MVVSRYIIHFVQEHINFRWTEFLALTSRNKCEFKVITDDRLLHLSPYIVVEINEADEVKLSKSVEASFLTRGLYELWAKASSLSELVNQVTASRHFTSQAYNTPEQTFKVNCESFGKKLSLDEKILMIEQLKFLDTLIPNLDLKNPNQIYHLLNYSSKNLNQPEYRCFCDSIEEYYFARQICLSNRSVIHEFNLKERKFIANTTMDPLLSFVIANIAKIGKNDFVYDPFVGSGGLIIAAAYNGAKVFGTDIDFLLLHGLSRPSRINQKVRTEGETVLGNMKQYGLESQFIDVVVSDVSKSCLTDSFKFDAIIADPPYGVRESSERVGSKKQNACSAGHAVRYPAKINYLLEDLMKDLLALASRHLKIDGRLVYFLPVARTVDDIEACLPSHPCLKNVSFCEQRLSPKISRLLVVMEKTREATIDDQPRIAKQLIDMNFRKIYFNE